MHDDLRGVSERMKELGLAALAHALGGWMWDSEHIPWNVQEFFRILQAAHSAEILIKACIAEQHPLLIFTQLPKLSDRSNELLSIRTLFESGKTLDYSELPSRLWATTGYKIEDRERYDRFGKLRNAIQHFAPPEGFDVEREVLEFVFRVIEPLINHFWGLHAINYVADEEMMDHQRLLETLIRYQIPFKIPEELEWLRTQAEETLAAQAAGTWGRI